MPNNKGDLIFIDQWKQIRKKIEIVEHHRITKYVISEVFFLKVLGSASEHEVDISVL